MHSWFVLILFGTLLVQILSRPHQAEYNNESDLDEAEEEEENEPAAEEFLTDEDDTRLTEQEPAVQEEELPRSRHLLDLTESRYLQRNAADDRLTRTKMENLSESKSIRNRDIREENPGAARFNEQIRSFPKRRQSNRYIESNDDQQEATQHLTNRDVNKSNRIVQDQGDNQINKRTVEFEGPSNEEGEMLFEKNRDQISKINKNEYNNNDALDSNEQSRYFKQYYNAMQAENRDILEDKTQDGARFNLRDRRDIKEADPADTPNASKGQKENNDKTDSEDEETAIKRHIKKLSGYELDQLLNSLTDEKKELLKKIIDDVDASDSGFINKREITKKAGAVEENNFIENCQSDLSKVQGGSPVVDLNPEASPSPNTESTEISKQPESPTEGNEISSPKSAETTMNSVNKIELSNQNDEGIQKKTDSSINKLSLSVDPKIESDIVANVQVTSKTENKRETNLEDLDGMSFEDPKMIDNDMSLQNGQDYANDQGYFSSQDENLSKFLDDEPQFHQDGKPYKRETDLEKKSDLADSMKSLEESFPNSNAYDEAVPYSGPLVRVKRKNSDQVVKKRSAGLLPDAKVAYFPYRAENEDEDNDEGNEFDDEGFYDRTSNFANSKGLEDDTSNADRSVQAKNSNDDSSKSPNANLEGDTSLGSDSDSVLSGVGGVDDNLMYSSGARNRRTAEDNSRDTTDLKLAPSTSLLDREMKSASENNFNAPHYQENDAFGPLPRNYDGDLTRYKRIRRVKQSHNAQELTSDG